MQNTQCIRCGKMRIVTKTWKERVGLSLIKYTLATCPDTECQKYVDELLKNRQDIMIEKNKKSLERRENMRKNIRLKKN